MRLSPFQLISTALATILAFPIVVSAMEFQLSFPAEVEAETLDGRILLLLSTNDDQEPRFQVRGGVRAIQIFGVEVDDLIPGVPVGFDDSVPGYPMTSLVDLPAGATDPKAKSL